MERAHPARMSQKRAGGKSDSIGGLRRFLFQTMRAGCARSIGKFSKSGTDGRIPGSYIPGVSSVKRHDHEVHLPVPCFRRRESIERVSLNRKPAFFAFGQT
jgi:hypothetical protein